MPDGMEQEVNVCSQKCYGDQAPGLKLPTWAESMASRLSNAGGTAGASNTVESGLQLDIMENLDIDAL